MKNGIGGKGEEKRGAPNKTVMHYTRWKGKHGSAKWGASEGRKRKRHALFYPTGRGPREGEGRGIEHTSRHIRITWKKPFCSSLVKEKKR